MTSDREQAAMKMAALEQASFGELTPLLAPKSVAIIGASDRAGNVGGAAVQFLRKYGYPGAIWPINPGRPEVAGLPCFPSLKEAPGRPDLAILAVPADGVIEATRDCVAAGVPAAIAWAGGFAEVGPEGREKQRQLAEIARAGGLKLCGPNCIGIINTSIGLTASFTSMLSEVEQLRQGAISIVSQSGGTAVMGHARAEEMGYGFRLTVSCGNEATLTVADFIRAFAQDDGTRVIAVYTEGLSDAPAFVAALAEARRRDKPVVMLQAGTTEASGRAALAHTGRLAGSDRTFDALFREFAVMRVYSVEEMLDLCLQLAYTPRERMPRGDRVLLSTFGGGAGVMGTDQCGREGLTVPQLGEETRKKAQPLVPSIASLLNPVDLTPGAMTNEKLRATLPQALDVLVESPEIDTYLFLSSAMGKLAFPLVDIIAAMRDRTRKPVMLSWLSPPAGTVAALEAKGMFTFTEHARAARALGHIVRHSRNLRHRIRRLDGPALSFDWKKFADPADRAQVISEHVVAGMLEAAGLPVAKGRIATSAEQAGAFAAEIGFPVAIKGLSPKITHRAAAGLVALNIDSAAKAAETERAFRARACELGAELDGVWVQRMMPGGQELLVTALRDPDLGVMVGIGVGGAMTEIVDDVVFARAPVSADGALDLLDELRTLRRRPEFLSAAQRRLAADFTARFSALVAAAPWRRFTFEINPLKLTREDAAAVDGLLIVEGDQ